MPSPHIVYRHSEPHSMHGLSSGGPLCPCPISIPTTVNPSPAGDSSGGEVTPSPQMIYSIDSGGDRADGPDHLSLQGVDFEVMVHAVGPDRSNE